MRTVSRFILVLILLTLVISNALAAEVAPCAVFGNNVSVSFSISSGTAHGNAYVTLAVGNTSQSTISIQCRNADGSWHTISSVIQNGCDVNIFQSVAPGTYRVRIITLFYDSCGNYIDSITKYTASRTY